MPKALRLLPIACAALALGAGTAARGEETEATQVAQQTIQLIMEFCIPDLTATEMQTALLDNGWLRIGGEPQPASSSADQTVRVLVNDANAISDRWQFYNHPEFEQILSFTTPRDEPEVVRDCLVDGQSIEPNALVAALLDRFGIPVQGQPGLAHWSNWLGTNHTLIIAETSVANHNYDGGMMLVLRNSSDPSS